MRSAGVSITSIIYAVMRVGIWLALISLVIGELVAPVANRTAREFKSTTKDNHVAFWSIYGFWTRDGRSFVNIRQIEDRTKLRDITIFDLDFDKGLDSIRHAEMANYIKRAKNWQLSDVKNTVIRHDQVIVNESKTNVWESVINPDLLNVVIVNAGNLSILDLHRYIRYLQENGQQSHKFELAFWQRVIDPFITMVMLLVAVPFVMNVSRSVPMGQRMLLGIVVGLAFVLFDRTMGHLGLVYHFEPAIAAILPGAVFLVSTVVVIRRMA